MSDRRPEGAPRVLRRFLDAALPDDDWSREFVEELDRAYEEIHARKGRVRAVLWYAVQLLSPRTLAFVWAVRRRGRWDMAQGSGSRLGPWSGITLDMRHALRGFAKEPRAAAFIVVTLAVAIGSVSTMYGVAERLFLQGPSHVLASDELARVFLSFDEGTGRRMAPWIPYQTVVAIRDQARVPADAAVYRRVERLARVADDVRPRMIAQVDGSYFGMLGVVPFAGRLFDRETAGRGGEGPPAVLSHALASATFGDRANALNSSVAIEGATYTVVGVAPEGFAGPHLERVDLWIPIDESLADRTNWHLVLRLPPGSSTAAVEAEAQAIHLATPPGASFRWALDGEITLTDLSADDTGSPPAEASIAGLLLGVVVLLLVIAFANVANLLLARMARRGEELVVRLALGVGRWRLMRLLFVEGIALALAGAALSLPVAYGAGMMLRAVLLPDLAWSSTPVDRSILVATALVGGLSAIVIALLPARSAGRVDLAGGLGGSRSRGGRGRTRMRAGLAVTQVALSTALLMGAGLFLKSFWTLRTTDLGTDADAVFVVTLRSLDGGVRPGSEDEARLYDEALRSVSDADPGARAALAVGVPFISNYGWSLWVPGSDSIPVLPGGGPYVSSVGDGYFEAVGTRLLRGSVITREHVDQQAAVIVVSEAMARTLWPGGDAIGRCVRVGQQDAECSQVVGVVTDVHRVGYREPPSMQFYVPMGRQGRRFSGTGLVVRPSDGSAGAIQRLSAALADVDPIIDHVDVVRLADVLEAQVRPWRLGASVLSLAALLAVIVAVVGVYGVLSYAVETRRGEIGVRMALGARRESIGALMLRGGFGSGVAGLVSGIALVLLGGRWIGPLLFETPVADPVVIAAVSAVLLVSVAAASVLPARSASRVDPITCLRVSG